MKPRNPERTEDSNSLRLAFEMNGIRVFVMDSVSYAGSAESGHVIVTGSHGGDSAGEYAALIKPLVTVCNDAGFGKNDAGVRGMSNLDDVSCIGICVSNKTARIGDGESQWEGGVVSYVNATAASVGFSVGTKMQDAVFAFLDQR